MPGKDTIRLSLNRPRPRPRAPSPLFRAQAVEDARQPLRGEVMLAMPPSAPVAALVSLAALALLALAAFIVEVPRTTRAVGVLMPEGGFIKIAAAETGQVTGILVGEGEQVTEGQPLLSLGSDRRPLDRAPLSASQIESLESERRLLEAALRDRQRIQNNRVRAVEERIVAVQARLRSLAGEAAIEASRRELLQTRYERLERLAANGNVPALQRDDAQLDLLQARAAAAVLERQAEQAAQERRQLLRERADLVEEASLQQTEAAIAAGQLQRQVAALQAVVSRQLEAPASSVVARVLVRPGQLVHAGQTLVTLHAQDALLQAWLYLSSANTGLVETGQEVALRLDAWPHQVFGTQPATVTSISRIALLPSELDVPLALAGPVFEARAALARQHVRTANGDWPLTAGTSFRADVVQQRYRLYQWLLRLRQRAPNAPADA